MRYIDAFSQKHQSELSIYLIPRYSDDTVDPRGSVRWIKPDKAPYWKE